MRPIDADALLLQETIITDENGDELNVVHGIDVRCAPTISTDDVRGVGEWERINYTVGHDYKCLACGKLNDRASNYCPDCGKPMRMKGAEDGTTD